MQKKYKLIIGIIIAVLLLVFAGAKLWDMFITSIFGEYTEFDAIGDWTANSLEDDLTSFTANIYSEDDEIIVSFQCTLSDGTEFQAKDSQIAISDAPMFEGCENQFWYATVISVESTGDNRSFRFTMTDDNTLIFMLEDDNGNIEKCNLERAK